MQNKGLVSVVVPIYNVETYLDRCINSIIAQTYTKLEIILVDDGSPDNCGKMCDQWEKKDSRIKVVHKTNGGLGLARNSGLDVATGEYVVFIDSDDYIKNNYISLMVSQMDSFNSDLVVGGFIRKFATGKEIENPVTKEIQVIEKEHIIQSVLLPVIGSEASNPNDVEREMCVWRNMYKKSIIDKLGLRFVSEREYVSEDIFFNMLYFINTERAVLIPECIYYYWDNGTSLTNTYRSDRYEKYCKMLKKQIEILKMYKLYDVAEQRLFRTFIMKTKKCFNLLSVSNLSMTEKIEATREILYSHVLEDVIEKMDKQVKGGIVQRVVVFLMKYKISILLILLFKLKNRRR